MTQGFEKMLKVMGIDVPALKGQAENFVADIRNWFVSADERMTKLEARIYELEMHAGFEPDIAAAREGAARTEMLSLPPPDQEHLPL